MLKVPVMPPRELASDFLVLDWSRRANQACTCTHILPCELSCNGSLYLQCMRSRYALVDLHDWSRFVHPDYPCATPLPWSPS